MDRKKAEGQTATGADKETFGTGACYAAPPDCLCAGQTDLWCCVQGTAAQSEAGKKGAAISGMPRTPLLPLLACSRLLHLLHGCGLHTQSPA